jgi:cupin 2 domain-containing protein
VGIADVRNLLAKPEGANPADGERFEDILAGDGPFRLERIVSFGDVTPEGQWYDQDHDEWVLVLAGSAGIAFADGGQVDLVAGDSLLLPRRCRHRVVRTSDPCHWLALHGARLEPASSRGGGGPP